MRWQKVCILAIWFHNFSRSTSSCYWCWLYLFLLRRIREFEKWEGRSPYTVLSLLAQLRCLPILPSFSFLCQCLNNHPILSLSFAKPLSSHSWITKFSKAMQHGREIGEIPKQVTRRKAIKRTFFNIRSNLGHFTVNFKTDLMWNLLINNVCSRIETLSSVDYADANNNIE